MKVLLVLCLLVATASAWVVKPGHKSHITADEFKNGIGRSKKPILYNVIFPGTKWCGDGDIAEDYDDLGEFINTDKCCRTHDHCDDSIPGGESKYGLVNEGSYTRSHCDCDLLFYDCLSKTECTTVSGMVGISYFNVLGEQCFDFKHPATCVEYNDIIGFRPRCVKYEYDETKPEEWQWFDVPRWLFGPDHQTGFC